MRTRNLAPDCSSSFPAADLGGAAPSPVAPESQDMSTFLNQFFHHKPILYHSVQQPEPEPEPQPPPLFSPYGLFSAEICQRSVGSEWECQVRDGDSGAAVESSCGVNVSDPGYSFEAEVKACAENAFSLAGVVDSDANERRVSPENYLDELSCDSEKDSEGLEVLAKSVSRRSSSKRSRAAEVHNLSEKRRRSRINEKMKALQNLIPNSNKTDKASMLDEAIEYLKQLQLQVQMLAVRNGLGLHPMFLLGVQQPMQLPQAGVSFDEGNGYPNPSRGTGTFSGNQENFRESVLNLSSQPFVIPSATNITIPETSLGFEEESAQAHYEPLNHSSSKVILLR
ncbi:hypothetical protein FH972_018071 [Carpinus fangiana]|uniref:BHLH domain-containing protein n=1 Tax=Carpinus fangiana TaxID=176857 RepID=A0A5N6RP85_9ROSI|nr:hypothetical protein FH972_018071 [Carpinus fangiana]